MSSIRRRAVAGLLAACLAAPAIASARQQSDPSSDAARIDKLLEDGSAAARGERYLDMGKAGEEALRLATAAADRRRIVRALTLVGGAYYSQSRFPEARAHLERAEKLAIELEDVKLQKAAVRSLGHTLRNLGLQNDAFHKLKEWFALDERAPEPEHRGSMIRGLAILLFDMGDYASAETELRKALAIGRERKDVVLEAASLSTLAMAIRASGKPERMGESIKTSLEGIELARANKFPALEAEMLNALGATYYMLQRLDEAAASFEAAFQLAVQIGYGALRAQTIERLGIVQFARGRYEEALEAFGKASAEFKALGDAPEKRQSVETERGQAAQKLGRYDEALAHYGESIALVERVERSTVPTEVIRALSIAIRRLPYEHAADLLVEMQRPGDALEMADRSRGRAFLNSLNESKVDLRAALSPDERAKEQELARQIAAARGAADKLAAALSAQEAFYSELRRKHPAYADLAAPQAAPVERIQRELVPEGTAFVEYLLGPERSFGWVVTRDAVRVAVLPARDRISAAAEENRKALLATVTVLNAASERRRQREAARALYDIVFAPLEPYLAGATRLIVVPDGTLTYVPFEALVSPRGRYLLERYTITYSQSASAALALRGSSSAAARAPKALAAFGDPAYANGADGEDRSAPVWNALPSTRDEVLAIARLYPASGRAVRLGTSASESAVKSEDLRQYRYLHFAVHGLMDEQQPSRSGLALSREASAQDGMLRMGEIAQLRLNADLVTLSACETGVGRLLQGEGLLSLSRAFFYAGARQVMATLWNVNDRSTAELMKTFYTRLAAGAPPEAALRHAQLAMLRSPRAHWRHPRFWSAFVLQR